MKYYTQEEIEVMKRSGYDSRVIHEAREFKARADELIEIIRSAFAGVSLEDGIGLLEADGLDDYKSDEELAQLRERDIKEDWESISPEYINKGWCSISFYDQKGMRFYLPAYLIADIKGYYRFDLFISFVNLGELGKESKFSLLTQEQRKAVKAYLEYYLSIRATDFMLYDIQYAIDNYWDA